MLTEISSFGSDRIGVDNSAFTTCVPAVFITQIIIQTRGSRLLQKYHARRPPLLLSSYVDIEYDRTSLTNLCNMLRFRFWKRSVKNRCEVQQTAAPAGRNVYGSSLKEEVEK